MRKPHLSADSLAALNHALTKRVESLTDLHHRACAFGATDPFIRNVQLEVKQIEDAKTQLAALFEAQFPPVKSTP